MVSDRPREVRRMVRVPSDGPREPFGKTGRKVTSNPSLGSAAEVRRLRREMRGARAERGQFQVELNEARAELDRLRALHGESGKNKVGEREAHEDLHKLHVVLDLSGELSKLTGDLREFIQKRLDGLIQQTDALISLGASSSPSQVLVVVLAWPMSQEELADKARAADPADKKVLDLVGERLDKAHLHFWSALAHLGKVKEWSASLEVSAGGILIRGTGGISVTFGK